MATTARASRTIARTAPLLPKEEMAEEAALVIVAEEGVVEEVVVVEEEDIVIAARMMAVVSHDVSSCRHRPKFCSVCYFVNLFMYE